MGAGGLLDSYELERRPVAAQTVDEAVRNMASLAPELAAVLRPGSGEPSEASWQAAADAIRRTKDGEFHSLGLTLGYRYDNSPVIFGATHRNRNRRRNRNRNRNGSGSGAAPAGNDTYRPNAAPGGRLPHFRLDGESLYDRLGPEFSLVGDLSLPAAGAFAKAAAALGVPLEVVGVDASDCAARFEAGLVLVRPDQHVAWRGDHVDDAEQVLRAATGGAP